ncbi:unnamed protein product [Clonostachys rhizophaga]|uniref:mRNA export factor GLE1 n=1 Tax=Clonostachys rhizophaga TaxID=160324 RepID=A0A9N9YSL9_9HYPO|nr:unnamed protein product [Clonostachys rhizophaga]
MTRSSPPASRRSLMLSSPDRRFLSSFLGEDRNTECSHRDALEAAQAEHDRVREAAIRAYQLHELELERKRIAEAELQEKQRLQVEAQIAAEELRLRELKAKTIPKPPPEPPSPKVEPPPPNPAPAKAPAQAPAPAATKPPTAPTLAPPTASTANATPKVAPSTSIFPPAAAKQNTAPANPFQNAVSKPAQPNNVAPSQPTNGALPPTKQPAPVQPVSNGQPANQGLINRYTEIHQELKKLRKNLVAESKVPGSPMKGKLGAYRREIRVSIGQLTGTKGANAQPTSKIMAALRDALEGKVPSPPIDVSRYVVDQREPAEGALHNDLTMPSLFLYLLNICAKSIISQFINEGGANPKSADPIGVFTAQVFSTKEFMWRGQPLIDILMSKFRVVCPVVFGLRGNDKTERGRIALGWKKDGPSWITEQSHNDRMTGLGAGFAAVSLRDFSKSARTNPYPPTNYWVALAGIVNSPVGQISNTQYVVLRAMIGGYEQRFLNFYGNAGLAALRLALIEFPKKAPENAAAAGSLRALAEVLRESGLVLT